MSRSLFLRLAFITLAASAAVGASQRDVLVSFDEFPDLQAGTGNESHTTRVTRVFRALTSFHNPSKASVIRWLRERNLSYREFYISQQILVRSVSAEIREAMGRMPGVKRIDDDIPLRLPGGENSFRVDIQRREARAVQSNIVETGAPKFWQEFSTRGEGIIIGNADTGFSWQHPVLKSTYAGFSLAGVSHQYAWHDAIVKEIAGGSSCGYNLAAPCDDHGHGTHTMGTVLGDDGKTNAIGMAPGSTWMGCRNMDKGVGRVSTYLDCFQFFLAPYPMGKDPVKDADPSHAPHIITNSWACLKEEGCKGDEFQQALQSLRAAGIFVIVAGGNEGPGCGTLANPPAVHSALTFTVGAYSHSTHVIASFSNRGPSKFDGSIGPDLTAPGVSIRSSLPGDRYGSMDGTSMAAPHVAGAVLLLWSARRDLIGKIDETSELLRQGATPKTSSQTCGNTPGTAHPNNTYGYGFLNVFNTLIIHR